VIILKLKHVGGWAVRCLNYGTVMVKTPWTGIERRKGGASEERRERVVLLQQQWKAEQRRTQKKAVSRQQNRQRGPFTVPLESRKQNIQ
jgi:hypothetical protein